MDDEEMANQLAFVEANIDRGAHHIPAHMVEGVKRYVLRGIPPGDGMRLILENDFMAAHGRLDEDNRRMLSGWCLFLYNYVPGICKGSPERVKEWIAKGGIAGRSGQ